MSLEIFLVMYPHHIFYILISQLCWLKNVHTVQIHKMDFLGILPALNQRDVVVEKHAKCIVVSY